LAEHEDHLEGKVAVITGAGRGIGAAIAAHLSSQGVTVAVCDIDGAAAVETAEQLPGTASSWQVDVTDGSDVSETLDAISGAHGPVDILVNNAGIDIVGSFLASTEADWTQILAVNVFGTMRCTKHVLPAMVQERRGRIINIASDAAKVGAPGEVVYSASKGAVVSFSKAVAREVAASGVTINCVCPGPVQTRLLDQVAAHSERLRDAFIAGIPMGRVGTPADVAPLVTFLAGPGGAYVTGQAWSVSGGLTTI